MDKYKKFILRIMLVSIAFVGLYGAMAYIRDPLMLLHKPYFKNNGYDKDLRISNASVMHNVDFDSVIIGTSMLQNTSAKEADEKLGGKWMNLSLAGSTLAERAIVLEYFFKRKRNVQVVIYSLDAFTLAQNRGNNTNFKSAYEDDWKKRFGLYLNKNTILCALQFSKKAKCIGSPLTDPSLEDFVKWIFEEDGKMRFGGFENWLKGNDEAFKKRITEPI